METVKDAGGVVEDATSGLQGAVPNGRATQRQEEREGGGGDGEEGEEEGPSLSPPHSKEDSVTEEKEMEERKQESSEGGGGRGAGKLNNSRVQPVSVPYGGARPKQPVALKLQIPRPLSGQVQNQLCPAPASKNKNLENQSRTGGATDPALGGGEPDTAGMNGESVESPSDLLMSTGSPDNEIGRAHV